jgi:hypothetical protein
LYRKYLPRIFYRNELKSTQENLKTFRSELVKDELQLKLDSVQSELEIDKAIKIGKLDGKSEKQILSELQSIKSDYSLMIFANGALIEIDRKSIKECILRIESLKDSLNKYQK